MVQSKDLIILVIGIILSLIPTIGFGYYQKLNQYETLIFLMGILALLTLGTTWILYKRLRESEESINKIEEEQKRLKEKLKIHEQLIDIRKDIEILKERGKNEKRK